MKIEKVAKRLGFNHSSDMDDIGMILSNKIDYGGPDGGMISLNQFEELSRDILYWHKLRNMKEDLDN